MEPLKSLAAILHRILHRRLRAAGHAELQAFDTLLLKQWMFFYHFHASRQHPLADEWCATADTLEGLIAAQDARFPARSAIQIDPGSRLIACSGQPCSQSPHCTQSDSVNRRSVTDPSALVSACVGHEFTQARQTVQRSWLISTGPETARTSKVRVDNTNDHSIL